MIKKIISLIIVISCILEIPTVGFAQSSKISVGDTVIFGSYNQDLNKSGNKQNLEWIVLDVDDGEALLITKLCLDNKPYNDKKENVTWETCSLRKWLNGEFYDKAFSSSEKNEILYTSLSTPNNSALNTDGGNNTKDKVFILSESEAENYFKNDSDRIAGHISITNVKTSEKMNWWLRTPGIDQKSAVLVVGTSGSLLLFGDTVTNSALTAVRPCIKVEVSALTGDNDNEGYDGADISKLDINPGDNFYLGTYEQDGNSANGMEPVAWRILYVEDDSALAISEYCIDSKPYNEKLKDVTWEKCTLRKWLNKDFYNLAFSDEEKKCILNATVINKLSSFYDTDGGKDTKDNVFLLSADDALELLGNNNPNYKDAGLRAEVTPYAKKNGAAEINGYCFWWLRLASVSDQNKASVVSCDGCIVNGGDEVNLTFNAVRPCIWIDINKSLSLWTSNTQTLQQHVTSSSQQNGQIVEVTFAKSQRSIGGEFKDRQVDYNVFAKEIEDCCGCSFYYSSWKREGSKNSPTGMKEVYVRSKRCEDNNDDDGWIYVGSFNYTNEGKSFLVEMSWLPTDVYSVAVVNSKIDPNCVYSSSLGNEVIFYAVK